LHDPVRFQSRFKLTYGRRSKRPHPYPACAAAKAQENETLLELGIEAKSNFGSFTWIHPDLRGPGILEKRLRVFGQEAFITAPSTTTPVATYFHSATSSLRAKATMVVFFMRPPSRLTRSWNQRDSADCG